MIGMDCTRRMAVERTYNTRVGIHGRVIQFIDDIELEMITLWQ